MKREVQRATLRPGYQIAAILLGCTLTVGTLGAILTGLGQVFLHLRSQSPPSPAPAVTLPDVTLEVPTDLQFVVEGNTLLGDTANDTTTIMGDLVVHGKIIQAP